MDARGVLVEPRREHVVGLFERDAAHMVDALARLVILPAMRRAGRDIVVAAKLQPRRHDQVGRHHRRRGLRHDRRADRRLRIALVHHHPAHIVEHHLALLVGAGRAHPDDAARLVGILAQAQHRRMRRQRVAGIDRHAPAELGIAEIGHGIERDVVHGLADHDMEHQQVVERRARQADRTRELVRRIYGEARAVERRRSTRRRPRSACAAWRGGTPGRRGNPRRNCRVVLLLVLLMPRPAAP